MCCSNIVPYQDHRAGMDGWLGIKPVVRDTSVESKNFYFPTSFQSPKRMRKIEKGESCLLGGCNGGWGVQWQWLAAVVESFCY